MFLFFSRRPPADPAPAERLLSEVHPHVQPSAESAARVWKNISARVSEASVFTQVREELTPSIEAQQNVWQRVKTSIEAGVPSSVWDRLRDFVAPSSEAVSAMVWQRITQRLAPQPLPVRASWYPVLRWTASALLLALIIRVSPFVFMARGSAHSDVIINPTAGNVSVLISGLWQPLEQPITLQNSALIQTDADGAATVIAHDRAVLRLGASTTIAIHDVSDARSGVTYDPTISFYRGKLWVQGFFSDTMPALTVGTDAGKISLHTGSVSLVQSAEGEPVDVSVWNRRATVLRDTEDVSMFAGDRVTLIENRRAVVQKQSEGMFNDEWMRKNLQLDAVHQREIAEIQRQRLAQQAGVLPTSSLYPVKRLAEEMDVLLTIGSQARTEKRLAQAATRLNEAAALVQEGDSESAAAPLQEFKDTVLSVASGTGDLVTRALVDQQIATAASDLSAVLPDDQLYVVKEVVLEASTSIPESTIPTEVVAGKLLVDDLSTLKRSLEQVDPERDLVAARQTYRELEERFHALLMQPNALNAAEQTEAATTLSFIDSLLSSAEEAARPTEAEPVFVLSEDQVSAYTERIMRRIFVYHDPRSQFNQLILELQALRTHPDRGSILRELDNKLTSEDLRHFVKLEMGRLKKEIDEKAGNPS